MKEKKFTESDVLSLLSHIKEFNAGAIDKSLDKYIDKAYEDWLEVCAEKPKRRKWFGLFTILLCLFISGCSFGFNFRAQPDSPPYYQNTNK